MIFELTLTKFLCYLETGLC